MIENAQVPTTQTEVALRPGHPFNPYRMFNGLFIPEGLARSRAVSPGAKLAWDVSHATPVTMVAVTRLCARLERSATELEVLACLKFLRHERGLRPGTRSGPRSFAWFKTVVADYFRKRRERDMAADPAAYTPTSSIAFSPGSEFDAMTDAF